jgi:predicted metalloprotease with PDZ domain
VRRAVAGALALGLVTIVGIAGSAPSPAPSATGGDEITYAVDVREGARHRARVTMRVPSASAPLELLMPIWTPGAYEVRTWGRNVGALAAVDDGSGRALEARRTGPSTFRVRGHAPGATVRVSYEVYAPALTDDGTHVDEGHALVNGTSLFLLARGRERAPHRVTIVAPVGWRVACALDGGDGELRAPSYEGLVDAPIEIGRFAESAVEIAGVRVRVVVDDGGARPTPVPRALLDDIAALVEAEARALGPPPFSRYLVLIHLRDGTARVGGLEHAASTSVIVPRARLSLGATARPPASSDERDAYLELVYIVAHELVHAWDARLIRPAEHVPYDFERAVPAPSLWIAEGLADLYAHRAMRATGLWSEAQLLEGLEVQATRAVLAARRGHSIEDEAAMAWQAPDEAAFDPESWYARGHLAALALDATIRARTAGRRSLDDAVRALLDEARRRGGALPVDRAALERAVAALDPEAARLIPSLVSEPSELAHVGAALQRAGLRLDVVEGAPQPSFGWQLAPAVGGRAAQVVEVQPAGPAALAGVRAGDRVSMAGGGDLHALASPSAGASLLVEIARATQRMVVSLAPSVERPVRARVVVDAAARAEVAAWRAALLGGGISDRRKSSR